MLPPMNQPPRVNAMLREALRAKGEEQGYKYTYRQLAEATGGTVHWTYVGKVITGKRRPTPEILKAWAKALHPYFPLDDALMAAGYMPENQGLSDTLRRVARVYSGTLQERLGAWISELEADQQSGPQRGRHAHEEAPRPPAKRRRVR